MHCCFVDSVSIDKYYVYVAVIACLSYAAVDDEIECLCKLLSC